MGPPPAGRPNKVIGSPMYCSQHVLDLNYPTSIDDIEALGLSMLFYSSNTLSLTQRDKQLAMLPSMVECGSFATARENAEVIDYTGFKRKFEIVLTEQQLGLKI